LGDRCADYRRVYRINILRWGRRRAEIASRKDECNTDEDWHYPLYGCSNRHGITSVKCIQLNRLEAMINVHSFQSHYIAIVLTAYGVGVGVSVKVGVNVGVNVDVNVEVAVAVDVLEGVKVNVAVAG